MPRYRLRNTPASLDFNGTGSVTVSNSSGEVWNGTDDLTIFLRFNARPATVGSFLLAIAATGGNNRRYIQQLPNGNISVVTGTLGTETVVGKLKLGEWQSIALVTDSTNSRFRVYMNGSIAIDWTAFTPGTGTAPIGIGDNLAAPGGNSVAKQSEVGMWNRVLTSDEISKIHYDSVVPGNGLKAFWPLSEGSGTTANDISGNGNNGSIVLSNWSTDVPFKSRQQASGRAVPRNYMASLSFTKGSTRVETPIAGSALNNGYTLAAWVKVPNYGQNNAMFRSVTGDKLWFNFSSQMKIRQYNSDLGTPQLLTDDSFTPGEWLHVAATYNTTNNTRRIYVNGVEKASSTTTGALSLGSGFIYLGATNSFAPTNDFGGLMQRAVIYPTELTPAQINDMYMMASLPTGSTAVYNLNEGAGATVYDSSGNGNNGTIVGGSFVGDVPMKARQPVNRNLVYNGDFEYAPPVNVPQTAGYTFLDGTAGGSVTNRLFGYAITSWAGTYSAMYDSTEKHSGSYSLKLSTGAAGSRVRLDAIRQASDATGGLPGVFPVQPNTSYTCTYWMKTNAISGSAIGAFLAVAEMNGTYGSTASSSGTAINTTTGWTQYSFTFTTNSESRLANIRPILTGDSGGTANLIMDAWFDDIELRPTIPTSRQIIT